MIDKLAKLLNSQPGSIMPGENGEMGVIAFETGVVKIDDYLYSVYGNIPIREFVSLFVEIASRNGNNRRPKNPDGDKATQRQFRARFTEGYDMNDFRMAIEALHEDTFHNSPQNGKPAWYYADMEYITRADNLEKYLQRYKMTHTESSTEVFDKICNVYNDWAKEPTNLYWKEQWQMAMRAAMDVVRAVPNKNTLLEKLDKIEALSSHPAYPFIKKLFV